VRRRVRAPSAARDLLAFWGSHDVVPQTADLVLRAIALHQEHSLSFWDGLIVQAAVDAHCDVLLSEDLQDGRRFGELVIRNPFSGPGLHEPGGRGYVARRSSKIRSSGRATAGRSR
jgi:predicted nucleic acid-binding protein